MGGSICNKRGLESTETDSARAAIHIGICASLLWILACARTTGKRFRVWRLPSKRNFYLTGSTPSSSGLFLSTTCTVYSFKGLSLTTLKPP
jgi:hypothetical protein